MGDTEYKNDPYYRAAVDALLAIMQKKRLTPSEVRECAMHACILFESRMPPRAFVIGGVTYTPNVDSGVRRLESRIEALEARLR